MNVAEQGTGLQAIVEQKTVVLNDSERTEIREAACKLRETQDSSDSKFSDKAWKLKMGDQTEGLTGLNAKMGVDPDALGYQGIGSIQTEVNVFVKEAVVGFVKKLRGKTSGSSHQGEAETVITNLEDAIDKEKQDRKLQNLIDGILEMEHDLDSSLYERARGVVQKLNRQKSLNQRELELERKAELAKTVTDIVDMLTPNLEAQLENPEVARPKIRWARGSSGVLVDQEETNESELNNMKVDLETELKDALQETVESKLRDVESGRLVKSLTSLVKKIEDPELMEEIENLKDVMEVGILLRYIRFEKASEKKYCNGIRDEGRGPVKLEYFLNHRNAKEAKLSQAMVVALRLYTTVAYKFMNNPLRQTGSAVPFPLAATTFYANQGIKQLRSIATGKSFETLWRGMRSTELPDSFEESGGTELAFMSTTTDLSVAIRYSMSKTSLLFKIIPDSAHDMGAELQWLSAFPQEKEILYPPLTYLKAIGEKETISVDNMKGDHQLKFTVVVVKPYLPS